MITMRSKNKLKGEKGNKHFKINKINILKRINHEGCVQKKIRTKPCLCAYLKYSWYNLQLEMMY